MFNVQAYLADKSKTWELFDEKVSKHYDTLSDVISLGLYRKWYREIADYLPEGKDLKILDLATGTGSIPFAIMSKCPERIAEIVGIDLSSEMLAVFGKRLEGKAYADKIRYEYGDATALTLDEAQFDVVTMGCGIRNVSDPSKGANEIFRMLKPGGRVIFLEPALPENPVMRKAYLGYFRHVVPTLASVVSNAGAYQYFCQSVEGFFHGDDFLEYLSKHGFEQPRSVELTLGAIRLYIAERPQA